MSSRFHYIFDPFCGWCYVVAPLIRAVREKGIMPIVLHGGGMMVGSRRTAMTPEFREFVISHEHRMQAISGQPFGDGYRNGLLCDKSFVYDSEPPSTAILTAEALAGRGLDMLSALQKAHYIDGRNTTQLSVLAAVASELGIDQTAFEAKFADEAGKVIGHFEETRRWLERVGGQGFPTFAIEREGKLRRIEASSWYGKAEAFVADLVRA